MVTGHKGYIGTVLVPMLIDAGYEVIGMDNDLYRRCTYGEEFKKVPELDKDIRDAESDDMNGIEAVIHLAALSNDPLGNLDPELTADINYRGTIHLAKLAKDAGVKRFLFSSSCSNYGSAGNNMVNEKGRLNPVTPYGISKVKAEQDLAKLADDNFSPVHLRNATAYGISPRHRFDVVLNNLTAWAYTTGKVFLKSDGTPWRPIVHVKDISLAFLAALQAPRDVIHDQAFNIGRQEENFRIREIAEIVAKVVPDCKIEYAEDAGPDKRCYRVDCSKAAQLLEDFKPTWTAFKGSEELYYSYQTVGLTLDEFEGHKYNRIAHIRMLMEKGLLDNQLRWTSPSMHSHKDHVK
jgi:nucleoside-diphosphate-sugar epimerase